MKTKKPTLYHHDSLSAHDINRVAVEAVCEKRTVVKYLHGVDPVQGNMRIRIERALAQCGFAHLVRKPPALAGVGGDRAELAPESAAASSKMRG